MRQGRLALSQNPFTITHAMPVKLSLIPLAASLGLLMVGCDKPKTPAEVVKAATEAKTPPATQEAKPTTQELLTGKYKRLRLPNTPLSLMVPDSWKIDAVGPVTFVAGPSPFGTATIGLSSPSSIAFKQTEIDALTTKLESDITAKPGQFRRGDHRRAGNVQIIEKRFLGKPVTRDKLDEKGDPIPDEKNGFVTFTTTPVQWTLTLFVPADQDYSRYELNLIDLDADQMAVDEKLLDKIMGSVTVDGAVRNATTTP